MTTDIAHPHDRLVRRFLVDTELMTDLLLHYPQNADDQQAVQLLDLRHLVCRSPVAIDKNLIEGRGDLRFATKFKGSERQSNVFLLLEHQSEVEADFRFRGLKYIVLEYDDFRRETKGKLKFPYPVIIVLYHGTVPWDRIPTMDEMIDLVPGAKTGLLDYHIILIDISKLKRDDFKGHPALCAMLETIQRGSEGILVEEFDRIIGYFVSVRSDPRTKDWLHSLGRYAMRVAEIGTEFIAKVFSKIINEQEANEMVMTTAQKLRAEGIAEGEVKRGRSMVITALQTRFGRVPLDIEKAVREKSDLIALESLHVQAIQSDTLDEFADCL